MAMIGDARSVHPRGLVSLPQVVAGGTVVLLLGLAVALLGPGPGLPITTDLPGTAEGTSEDPTALTTVAGDAAATPLELPVAVRGPSRLLPGRAAPLEVRVSTAGSALGPDQRRLLLTLDLDLAPEARGWLVVDPPRLLTSAAGLADESLTLTGLDGLPCGTSAGTLTVTARELTTDGRSGSVDYELPGLACPDEDLPEAPESLHLQQRVWHDAHSDWRAQVARLLAPAPTPSPAPAATGGHSGGGSSSPAPAPAPAPSAPTGNDSPDESVPGSGNDDPDGDGTSDGGDRPAGDAPDGDAGNGGGDEETTSGGEPPAEDRPADTDEGAGTSSGGGDDGDGAAAEDD